MRVVVPFATDEPKTRLSPVLADSERAEFARAMLEDVVAAITATGNTPEVLATGPVTTSATVHVDERSLTPAVNAVLHETTSPTAIVMADLPLASPVALRGLFQAPGDVVLAPGRAAGTNAIVTRHPDFRVDYHGTSYVDHLAIAHEIGASVYEVDSHRLATDIDEPDDLVEVLVHGEGRAREWLVDAGFAYAVTDGRVAIRRR